MSELEVVMHKDKETPGTFRFVEEPAVGERALIGTLYIPKATVQKLGITDTITVTVKAA